jgi:hypothetical protein
MLTKFVNEKKNEWDEHLGAILFAYYKHKAHTIPISVWNVPINAYKIYVTYLHQGRYYITDTMKVLTNIIYELEKLKEI